MTEKLKYKVGDKVLVEAEVMSVLEGDECPYRIHVNGFYHWMDREFVEQNDLNLPPKPKVPQAVMDWYFKFQENNWDVESYLIDEPKPSEVDKWLYTGNRQLNSERQHALATLIAYGPKAVEVEKEKKYRVKIKRLENTDIALQYLVYDIYGYRFEINTLVTKDSQYEFTKQELIDAGFEGVFDNPMFEVEEVE